MNAWTRIGVFALVGLGALAAAVTLAAGPHTRPPAPNVSGEIRGCVPIWGCKPTGGTIRFVPVRVVTPGAAPVSVSTVHGSFTVYLAPGEWSFTVKNGSSCRPEDLYGVGFSAHTLLAPPRSSVIAHGPLYDNFLCIAPLR